MFKLGVGSEVKLSDNHAFQNSSVTSFFLAGRNIGLRWGDQVSLVCHKEVSYFQGEFFLVIHG